MDQSTLLIHKILNVLLGPLGLRTSVGALFGVIPWAFFNISDQPLGAIDKMPAFALLGMGFFHIPTAVKVLRNERAIPVEAEQFLQVLRQSEKEGVNGKQLKKARLEFIQNYGQMIIDQGGSIRPERFVSK
ncbi:MAG: hypothetical protein Pars93KO_19740 [Parasphingorhabdus sp.]